MRSLALLLLAGCLAPKYERPDAPVAESFPSKEPVSDGTEATLAQDWRATFVDAELQQIIDRALAENRDLRATALGVEQARQQLRLATSALAPSIDLQASYGITSVPASTSPFGEAYQVRQLGIGPAVSWELDLFGKLRYQRRSAAQATIAAAEDWRAARLALVASVAELVLTERVLAAQETLARETLLTRQETAELVEVQVEAGLASELELHQVRSLVAVAEVAENQLKRARSQTHNALTELVGAPVPPLEGRSIEAAVNTTLPPGAPSDLLDRRPDIRAAEHRLIATHADIGAARAAMFPQISLTGSANLASPSLLGLFEPNTLAWSFIAPTILQPIFQLGARHAQLKATNVSRKAALASYESAIQTAFREVADVLVAWPTVEDELKAQQRVVDAQQNRARLATQLWEAGTQDYLQLLDAERERFAAEQGLLDAELQLAMLSVDLFRVTGGGLEGWAPLPEDRKVPGERAARR